jgi:hypothetical protein
MHPTPPILVLLVYRGSKRREVDDHMRMSSLTGLVKRGLSIHGLDFDLSTLQVKILHDFQVTMIACFMDRSKASGIYISPYGIYIYSRMMSKLYAYRSYIMAYLRGAH